MNIFNVISLTVLFAGCSLATRAQGAVLYSHTFDGAAITLDGSSVDTAVSGTVLGANHGTNSNTWTLFGTNILQDGATSGRATASLGFTPQNGYIYTLSMTGTNTQNTGNWIAAGFWDGSGINPYDQGVIWALNRPSHSSKQIARINGLTTTTGNGSDGTNPSTIMIVLDTTDGAGLWDAEWFVNGVSFATATNMTLSNAITGVGVGNYDATASISSFSLEVAAVPEPSAALLVSLGVLLLLWRRR